MDKPNFDYEKKYWQKGFKFVIGIDEVGRGAWAGPVVVAAVLWPQLPKFKIQSSKFKIIEQLGIDDSKRLKPRERERLAKLIKEHVLAWDVTEVGVSVINKIGIGKATEKAMRKAVRDIVKLLDCLHVFVLIDFYHVPYLRSVGKKSQLGIKKGDQKSISIAAASILAKVYRDKLMERLCKKHKRYDWGNNKGYGTKSHRESILKHGLCRHHRKQFVKSWMGKIS